MKTEKVIAMLRKVEEPRTNVVRHSDSVEKILWQLSLVSPEPIRYAIRAPSTEQIDGDLTKGMFDSKLDRVLVSPSVFRRFECVSGCTACCQKFTLDYIPNEFSKITQRQGFLDRVVKVNGQAYVIFTNDQNANPICDFLRALRPGGGLGCAHWPWAPLSCASAPQAQFIQARPHHTYLMKKPFGRAWRMKPVPQCKFSNATIQDMGLEQMIGLLDRFEGWAKHFSIHTCLAEIRQFVHSCLMNREVPRKAVVVWERRRGWGGPLI